MKERFREGIGRITASKAVREKGFIMREHHCHPYFELFHVRSGTCRFTVHDSLMDLCEGDFLLIPPDVLHYTRYLDGPCLRDTLLFQREHLPSGVEEALPQGFFASPSVFSLPPAIRSRTDALWEQMEAEERILDSSSPALLSCQLGELFLLCARWGTFPSEYPALVHTTEEGIQKAARFICQNYEKPLSAEDIASASGFSQGYLSKRFRRAVGLSPHEYLSYIRLSKAALELVSTQDTVTDIALRCGFSDSNYFKDAFRRMYGMTPTAYRKGVSKNP